MLEDGQVEINKNLKRSNKVDKPLTINIPSLQNHQATPTKQNPPILKNDSLF